MSDSLSSASLLLPREDGFRLECSFEFPNFGITVLFGASGSGKTTVLRCIAGLERAKGFVKVDGVYWQNDEQKLFLPTWERPLGYVFQEASLFPHLTAKQNIEFAVKRSKSTDARSRMEEAIDLLGIRGLLGRKPAQLSGGERQRVILARAITQQPDIILLDEPTSALDLHHQIEVMELIRQLNEKEHITVLAVLHDINLASRFCSRIVILKDGKVKADGPPREIINRREMEELYEMQLLVKNNPLIEMPEIIPIRVMDEKQTANPLRIHVICGEKGGVRILEQLTNMGHFVSAGVVNRESDDAEICEYLGIPRIEINSFQTVGPEEQEKNLELMKDADAVIVADIPFGEANIRNLDGLEHVKGELYIHRNIRTQDFTHGKLQKRLEEIQKTKEIHFFEKFNAGDWQ